MGLIEGFLSGFIVHIMDLARAPFLQLARQYTEGNESVFAIQCVEEVLR